MKPRVSLQWYDPRDESTWSKQQLALWQKYIPKAKGVSTMRSNIKKHLEPRGKRADDAVLGELQEKRPRKKSKTK